MPPKRDLPALRRIKRAGVRIGARAAARLYLAYMWLVSWTSRVDTGRMQEVVDRVRAGRAVVLAMLHQDVLVAPYLFRDLGIVTLASRGDAGEVISEMLERCGFTVVRGGSSSASRTRRSPTAAFRELVDLGGARDAGAGGARMLAITPDGSRGPCGAVKPGVALLAHMIDADVFCLHVHARRARYLDTWDRTMVPLPFGRIAIHLDGPIEPPADTRRAQIEGCRREIEERLHEIHRRAFADEGRPPLPTLAHFGAPSTTEVTS